MVDPAVCPRDGVEAVGWCIQCREPFCRSCQGWRGQTYYVDMCRFCLGPTASESQRDREGTAKAFVTSGSAARMLRAANVSTVALHSITMTTEARSFGRYRNVEKVEQQGRGWLLGQHLWRYMSGGWGGGDDVESKRLTVLRDTSLLMIHQDQQGRYALSPSDPRSHNSFRGYYTDIYKQVHRLAGRAG